MAQEGTDFTTPVGRIVWGHPVNQQNKTDTNNKPVLGQDGQPRKVRSFGVAFTKSDFQTHIWPYLSAEAAKKFSQGVPPSFSWKYKDGDTLDRLGKPYADREGYAGCYVLTISSELPNPPPIYQLVNGAYVQLPGDAIKCGDYVAVGINAQVNAPTNASHTPGLYINPTLVELVGQGTLIVSQQGPDPMAVLGGQQRQLPPGATPPPMVAAPGMIPGQLQPMPGATMQPQMPQMQPAMQPMAQPQPQPVMQPVAVAGRPVDPAHVHNNGNGTEQWLVNGQWDGQQHPIPPQPVAQPVPAPLPPPQPGFVQGAGMPPQPQPMPMAQPGMPQQPMPGAVGMMPPPR